MKCDLQQFNSSNRISTQRFLFNTEDRMFFRVIQY